MENYTNLQEIGEGSYSIIYTATSRLNGDKVALKEIEKGTVKGKDIRREARILKYISEKSSKVISFREFFETDYNFYIVTEYLEGYITLDEFIRTSLPDVKDDIIGNIISGLLEIHNNGIAHRDVKPSNIMIHPLTHNIKFIDFGFSCDEESFQDVAPYAGTLAFIPPETIFRNIQISLEGYQKSDIWSLGLTIFETLYGDDYLTMVTMHISDKFVSSYIQRIYKNPEKMYKEILTFLKDAKPEFQELVLKYLQIDPQKRSLL